MNSDKNPVFIGGCDRSGTTLLASLLGAHPDCLVVPEFQFKIDLIHACKKERSEVAWDFISNNKRFKIWELHSENVLYLKKRFLDKSVTVSELIIDFADSYLRKTQSDTFKFWIDHTPVNLRFSSTLHEIYPHAKFIHIVRDGRAIARSVIPLDWGPNTITASAPWWLSNLAYGLLLETQLSQFSVLRVSYEELILSSEATLKQISQFLSIEYRSEMLTGHFDLPTYTVNQHQLVGKELEKSRINAWEDYFSSRQVEIFENLTGDMLVLLGYELKCQGITTGLSRSERFKYITTEYFQKQINKVRHRKRAYRYL